MDLMIDTRSPAKNTSLLDRNAKELHRSVPNVTDQVTFSEGGLGTADIFQACVYGYAKRRMFFDFTMTEHDRRNVQLHLLPTDRSPPSAPPPPSISSSSAVISRSGRRRTPTAISSSSTKMPRSRYGRRSARSSSSAQRGAPHGSTRRQAIASASTGGAEGGSHSCIAPTLPPPQT